MPPCILLWARCVTDFIPLLMPGGDDDKHVAFYFRERPELEVAENYVHVSAKAIWTEDILDGSVHPLISKSMIWFCLDSLFC
jgi:hypothetical protein